jgi:LAO/AO transport system kinase
MRDLAGDPGVFIRSMASRGLLGGLAAATSGLVQAFDAAGFEVIMIETVGAGQDEVDIARLAHTTLVVEAPGLGDDIQAIKAGILEIADVLVINKADRPGVESTERALRSMLQLAHPSRHVFQDTMTEWLPVSGHSAGHGLEHSGAAHHRADPMQSAGQNATEIWTPPIRKTVAPEGMGVAELMNDIERHRRFLEDTGEMGSRERSRLKSELDLMIRDELVMRWRERVEDGEYERVVERLMRREISPWQAVESLTKAQRR